MLITANVVVALGYGVVSPVLPQYARNFGVSISAATFVITAFSLMRLVSAPASGLFVQKMGERRVYVSGLLIVAVSTGACAFAQTYWQLLLFRSLGGFGSAMFTVSSLGLMIRISPPDARGRVAGLFSSAFLIGSVGGPVLGSLTAGLGLAAPFVDLRCRAAAGGGAWCSSACGIRRWRRRTKRHRRTGDAADCVAQQGVLRRRCFPTSRRAGRCSACALLWCRCSSQRCCIDGPRVAGLALATFAVGNVAAVIPSGYLSDRIGRRTLLIVGLAVSGVATVLVGLASSLTLFLAGALVAGAAAGMFTSPQQAAVADIIGSKARGGTAVATYQMMADFGAIVGSLAVGEIAQHLTFGAAFVISGAILLVGAVGWVLAPETRLRPTTEHTPARALGPEVGGELP